MRRSLCPRSGSRGRVRCMWTRGARPWWSASWRTSSACQSLSSGVSMARLYQVTLGQASNNYLQMLVDLTSSLSSSCCDGNVTGCCDTLRGHEVDDTLRGHEADHTRRLTGSCCRVTSRLRLGWVTAADEGLYTCSPAGLASLGLEDRLYIHVIHSPVVEER